ncbi:MAG: hypothetical protein OXC99_02470 [Chloroflexi bacterium]|nr:hypothetical protein [Chloroflexota bacterium]
MDSPSPDACSTYFLEDLEKHFLHWSSDGSFLVFDVDGAIWSMDIEGGRLHEVNAEVVPSGSPPADPRGYGIYADVSPDGSQIVYATCNYMPEPVHESIYGPIRNYEIAVANIDGTGKRRLTTNDYFDHFPAWSPDGTEVAFLGHGTRTDYAREYPKYSDLMVKATEWVGCQVSPGGDAVAVGPPYRVGPYPPVWSPDGQNLAFIALEWERKRVPRLQNIFHRILHTVRIVKEGRSDRPNDCWVRPERVYRIGETTAPPAWSPDNGELAFPSLEGEEVMIYAAEPDGTGRRTIWRGRPDGPTLPITQVSWSPDGTELLFVSDRVYLISVDGEDLRSLPHVRPAATPAIRAAWSPDGSRVALYYPGFPYRDPDSESFTASGYTRSYTSGALATISPDGSDLRVLVEMDDDGIPRLVSLTALTTNGNSVPAEGGTP